MRFKLNVLLAAAAFVAAGGAQAQLVGNNSTQENGSLAFIALDSVGAPVSIVANLGFNFSDMIEGAAQNTPGTSLSWNFLTNERTINGVTSTVGQWSSPFATFMQTAQSADLRWGVISIDGVQGATIPGRGALATGTPTVANMTAMSTSGPPGNIIGNVTSLYAANNALTSNNTHAGSNYGASVATAGTAYVGSSTIGSNFGGNLTWSYLTADGGTTNFQRLNQLVANPVVVQFGFGNTTDALSPLPAVWTFNSSTGLLTYTVPVPEPETYALMLAGLAAVGFMVRRRRV